MRRGRIFIYLALIIILGLVAAYVFYQRSLPVPIEVGVDMPEPTPVAEVNVVVVAQNTPRGTMLDETLLTTIPIPKSEAVESMFFSDMASVVGRRAKFDLDSGIPLTASMLVDSAEALSATGSNAALSIPRGMVAVSVPINRLSSVSYAPRPGDHVSVIVTMMFVDIDTEFQTILPNQVEQLAAPGTGTEGEEGPTMITLQMFRGDPAPFLGRTELDPILNELVYVIPGERQRARMVSQTLLYNVEVLQVGNFTLEAEIKAAEAAAAAAAQQEAEPIPEPQPVETPIDVTPPDVITLIVTPQDAVTLNYLLHTDAELTLALRATGDDSVDGTESATLQFLLDEYNITMPAKLPYSLEPRIDQLNPPVLQNDQQSVEGQ